MSDSPDKVTSPCFVESCKLAGLHCENWDDLKTIFMSEKASAEPGWFVRLLCSELNKRTENSELNTENNDVLRDVCHPLAGVFEAIFRKWRDAYSLAAKIGKGGQDYFSEECQKFCKSVIELCEEMDKQDIPVDEDKQDILVDAKMFFKRLKGDFCRNEVTTLQNAVSSTDRAEYIQSAKKAYRDESGTNAPASPNAQKKKLTLSQQKEEVTRQLNLWSIYSDIEGRPRKAINKAKKWLMEKTSCGTKQGSNADGGSVNPELLNQVRRQIMLWEASIQ